MKWISVKDTLDIFKDYWNHIGKHVVDHYRCVEKYTFKFMLQSAENQHGVTQSLNLMFKEL